MQLGIRSDPPTWLARARALLFVAILTLATGAGLLVPPGAAAHFRSFSVIELEGEDQITGRVRLPYDMLALLDLPEVDDERELVAAIRRYVDEHISARGADGREWAVRVSGGHPRQGNGVFELVFGLSVTPPEGKVTAFDLSYDAIIEQISSHRGVLVQRNDSGDYDVLGFFESGQQTVTVHPGRGSVSHFQEFRSAIDLGVEHISEGSDHLLFLLTLLLPAPLIARRGRWVRGDDPKRSALRIVHVVTCFAIGHSITLALAGLGLIHLPEQPIEALIALSILVSSVHALRPLIPNGEALIALGFGLVHGLAFASLLGELDLERSALLFTLLGFNVGIELTQLLVVALIMPSLYLLSRTPVYRPFRIGGGVLGIVLSSSWLLQRTTLTPVDPFEASTKWLIENPFLFVVAIAVLAISSYFLTSNPAPLFGPREQTE